MQAVTPNTEFGVAVQYDNHKMLFYGYSQYELPPGTFLLRIIHKHWDRAIVL